MLGTRSWVGRCPAPRSYSAADGEESVPASSRFGAKGLGFLNSPLALQELQGLVLMLDKHRWHGGSTQVYYLHQMSGEALP